MTYIPYLFLHSLRSPQGSAPRPRGTLCERARDSTATRWNDVSTTSLDVSKMKQRAHRFSEVSSSSNVRVDHFWSDYATNGVDQGLERDFDGQELESHDLDASHQA